MLVTQPPNGRSGYRRRHRRTYGTRELLQKSPKRRAGNFTYTSLVGRLAVDVTVLRDDAVAVNEEAR